MTKGVPSRFLGSLDGGSSGSSSALGGTAVVTVANGAREHEQTVAATGMTASSRVTLALAPHADTDVNSADLLPPFTMAATPGTDAITVLMAFAEPVGGPIRLNWSAA